MFRRLINTRWTHMWAGVGGHIYRRVFSTVAGFCIGNNPPLCHPLSKSLGAHHSHFGEKHSECGAQCPATRAFYPDNWYCVIYGATHCTLGTRLGLTWPSSSLSIYTLVYSFCPFPVSLFSSFYFIISDAMYIYSTYSTHLRCTREDPSYGRGRVVRVRKTWEKETTK